MSTMSANNKNHSRGLIDSGMFTLMMFGVSSMMIFASLTSAYLVRRAEGNWLEFEIPTLFIYSTGVILLSSATLHLAYSKIKSDNTSLGKIFTLITLLLGGLFLVTQFYAWGQLVDMKVFFGGSSANAAGSFMYVLTGVHAAHIVSAIIYLFVIFFKVLSGKINSSNAIKFKTCSIYWHFLGFVWIWLYVFLIIKH